MNSIPQVSVVIPAYNSEATIAKLLNAVTSENYNSYECIVIDDCSTDKTVGVIKSFSNVKYIKMSKNSGPSAARNRGIDESRGDIIIFIDSDIVPISGFIAEFMRLFSVNPDISAISGIYSKESLFYDGMVEDYRNLQFHYWKKSSLGTGSNFVASIGAAKKEDILEIGKFNTKYKKADVEDYEIGHRFEQYGKKILVTDSVQGRHNAENTMSKLMNVLFNRTREYVPLFMKRIKLENHYATPLRSIPIIFSPILLILIILSVFEPNSLAWAFLFYFITIVLPDFGLYTFIYRERGCWKFVLYAVIHLICNFVMFTGLLVGFLYWLKQFINIKNETNFT